MSDLEHREDRSVHLGSWILYSRESVCLTSLVKTGTSTVAHLEKHLERALESTPEPLTESSRVMVQDGILLVLGEFDTAFLKNAD